MPPQWAGLKFFNVFGPNEYHKGSMMSVLARRFDDIRSGRTVQLFKSHREGIADGDQRRDFIHVDDVVRVIMWLLATPSVNGIFNVGTGKARSFRDLILAAYDALGAAPKIEYVDMPQQIRGSYQYFTEAEVDRLRGAGYNGGFTALEDAVGGYVRDFLDRPDATADRAQGYSRLHVDLTRWPMRSSASGLCVGDLMLDEFVYGEVSRISPRPGAGDRGPAQRAHVGGAGTSPTHRLARRALHLRRSRRRRRGRRHAEGGAGAQPRIEPVLVTDPARPTTRKVRFVSGTSRPTCCGRTGSWRCRPPRPPSAG